VADMNRYDDAGPRQVSVRLDPDCERKLAELIAYQNDTYPDMDPVDRSAIIRAAIREMHSRAANNPSFVASA